MDTAIETLDAQSLAKSLTTGKLPQTSLGLLELPLIFPVTATKGSPTPWSAPGSSTPRTMYPRPPAYLRESFQDERRQSARPAKAPGHQSVQMTMRYAHLFPDHLSEAVKCGPLPVDTILPQ